MSAKDLLDALLNLSHSETRVSLREHLDDRVADGAETPSAIWGDPAG